MNFLKVENLVKDFGSLRALKGVSFGIDKGVVVGLLGPNGAGKTTCIDILLGSTIPNGGSVDVGLVILGIIFRYGTRIQALAWGIIFLFQPLTAVYFPVATLPPYLEAISYTLPPTYVFEMARDNLSDRSIQWDAVLIPFALNLVYLSVALWFFNYMYVASRRGGQFAKLGT